MSYSNVKNNAFKRFGMPKILEKVGSHIFLWHVDQKLEYSRRVYKFSGEIQDGRHINPMGNFPAMGTTWIGNLTCLGVKKSRSR